MNNGRWLSVILGVAVFSGVLALVVPVASASARANPISDAERYVQDGTNPNGTYTGPTCVGEPGGYNVGAVWVTNDYDGADSNRVVVEGNATSLNVRIYSTIKACGDAARSNSVDSQLAHISNNASQCGGGNLGFSIFGQGGAQNLYRANYNGTNGSYQNTTSYISGRYRDAGQWWSSQFQGNNYIRGTINLGSRNGNQTLCINSTYSVPNLCTAPGFSCFNSDRRVGFRIDRTYPFSLSAGINANRTTALPGQAITWNHSVRNNGPSNSSSLGATISGRYQNVNAAGNDTWNDGSRNNTSGALRARDSRNACLDVPGGSPANAFQLQVHACNFTIAQEWRVEPNNNNRIVNVNSSKCLDVPFGVTTPATPVNQHDCNGSPAQNWIYNQTTGQIFYRNQNSNLCLDRRNNSTANGGIVQIYTCNGSAAQRWLLDNSARTYDPNWAPATNKPGTTGNQFYAALNSGTTRTFTSSYTPDQDDVGNSVCRRTQAGRASDSNFNWMYSGVSCVSVPYNYTLTPTITNIRDGDDVDTGAGTIPVIGRVSNGGPTKSAPNIGWELTQIVFRPGTTDTTRARGGTSPGNACSFFVGEASCNSIGSGTESGGYALNGSRNYNGNGTVEDLPAGTRVCYVMSVQPYTHTTGNWRHSQLYCQVVSKKPKVQVIGGDLIVGRGSVSNPAPAAGSSIETSTSRKDGLTYGSWGEYGLMASSCITGMASGSGYSGGSSTNILSSRSLSLLSFTNPAGSSCGSGVGGYVHTSLAPNVSARFPINVPAASATPSRPASPAIMPGARSGNTVTANIVSDNFAGLYQAPAGVTNITLTGGDPVPAGRWTVINAPAATVTITGDIRYTNGALRSLDDIPQVVIIARNIIIADNVTNIDSWLVAVGSGTSGVINTCGAGSVSQTSNLTIDQCADVLTVNGPVMANSLIMRRTAGSGVEDESGLPAEVFNLRADSYIWATTYNQASGRLSTSSTIELPARF